MISTSQDELQSRYEENVCAHGIYAKDYCGLCNGPTALLGQDEPAQTHEWLGCEEVNDWFVAQCSCGWQYQHPNYGTTQDTFVNHWGDHILTQALTSLSAAQDKLDRMPADWFENSSLELWFPFTAAELRGAHEQIEQLEASLAEAQKTIEELYTQVPGNRGESR